MPVPAPSWEKKWKWPHKYFEFKSLCNKNHLIFSCVNVYVIPSPCTPSLLSPSTSIIHCPFLYVLLVLNSAPLQPGTDVFEFTLAFMCTSFHTVLCRVGHQKAIAHVRAGSSQLSTKEQSVVTVWLWWDGGTSRQYLFFFCCLFSRPCNTEELCFVSCHSQKNTDVKQKVLWLMADQRRQRWKKAVECICAHNHSSLSHQECMIQPASRARAAPLGLAYQKLCWTWCSLSRSACRALFPGLWQGTFWFSFGSCEPRLGLL